jgi:hypothetical protein
VPGGTALALLLLKQKLHHLPALLLLWMLLAMKHLVVLPEGLP